MDWERADFEMFVSFWQTVAAGGMAWTAGRRFAAALSGSAMAAEVRAAAAWGRAAAFSGSVTAAEARAAAAWGCAAAFWGAAVKAEGEKAEAAGQKAEAGIGEAGLLLRAGTL